MPCTPRRSAAPTSTRARGLPIFLAASVFLIAGCQTAMSNQATASVPTRDPETYPLRFKQHNFEAHCYNTLDCHVLYNGANTTRTAVSRATPAPVGADYKQNWGGAPFIGIRNFPGPVEIQWKAKSGADLTAEVDLSEIFKNELVLHSTPLDEIPEKAFKGPAGEPLIIVEVNDRTVSVYMQMLIPTKSEQIPGNPNSHFRDDIVLAWSKTY